MKAKFKGFLIITLATMMYVYYSIWVYVIV